MNDSRERVQRSEFLLGAADHVVFEPQRANPAAGSAILCISGLVFRNIVTLEDAG